MTVGRLIHRVEQFRQEVLKWGSLPKDYASAPVLGSDQSPSQEWEHAREKLLQHYHEVEVFLKPLRHGACFIAWDGTGPTDLYELAFSGLGHERHLDLVVENLDRLLAELYRRPPEQSLHSHQKPRHGGPNDPITLGQLGHLERPMTPHVSPTLQTVFDAVDRLIQQQIHHPQDQNTLRTHLRALADHPAMAEFLPLGLSHLR